LSPSKASNPAKDIAKSVKKSDVEKMASTSTKGLPQRVKKEIKEIVKELVSELLTEARTIGAWNVKKLKTTVSDMWKKNHNVDEEQIVAALPSEWWDTWEMADQEIRRIIDDELTKLVHGRNEVIVNEGNKCNICGKSAKENTEGNTKYCQGHSQSKINKLNKKSKLKETPESKKWLSTQPKKPADPQKSYQVYVALHHNTGMKPKSFADWKKMHDARTNENSVESKKLSQLEMVQEKLGRELTVPEKHQLAIAYRTMKMPDQMVGVAGGTSKSEAVQIIKQLTGKDYKERNEARKKTPSNPVTESRISQLCKCGHSLDKHNQETGRCSWCECEKPIKETINESVVRPLHVIASEIRKDWKNVNYAAKPYLEAMSQLESTKDEYGADSGSSIVAYFLSNASSWRGETAKRIKAELNQKLKLKEGTMSEHHNNEFSPETLSMTVGNLLDKLEKSNPQLYSAVEKELEPKSTTTDESAKGGFKIDKGVPVKEQYKINPGLSWLEKLIKKKQYQVGPVTIVLSFIVEKKALAIAAFMMVNDTHKAEDVPRYIEAALDGITGLKDTIFSLDKIAPHKDMVKGKMIHKIWLLPVHGISRWGQTEGKQGEQFKCPKCWKPMTSDKNGMHSCKSCGWKEKEPENDVTNESIASDQAKKMGLEYFGFGRYGKKNKQTHKVENGKLVPAKRKVPAEHDPQRDTNKPSKMVHDEPIPMGTKVPKAENFNDDTDSWFDDLSELTDGKLGTIAAEDKTLDALRKLSKQPSTENTLRMIKRIAPVLKRNMIGDKVGSQIDAILQNMYKREFKKQYGEHSQTSEFLSMLRQATK
jgi:hypothetical protein